LGSGQSEVNRRPPAAETSDSIGTESEQVRKWKESQ
jgi:hypothetical protein